jgi:hypothetical protein
VDKGGAAASGAPEVNVALDGETAVLVGPGLTALVAGVSDERPSTSSLPQLTLAKQRTHTAANERSEVAGMMAAYYQLRTLSVPASGHCRGRMRESVLSQPGQVWKIPV